MSAEAARRIDELVGRISRYLAANPSACDTAEGIHQWWLAGTSTPQDVSAALDHLVRAGSVERLVQHSSTVYRAKHAPELNR